ncbi:hypothetical protein Gotur_024707 [Gossypium turneri]
MCLSKYSSGSMIMHTKLTYPVSTMSVLLSMWLTYLHLIFQIRGRIFLRKGE